MGPHGINRAVHRIAFSDCENGLGIKVIGGFKEQTGEEYGIYVKRVLHRGVAANDGRLQAGDLILEVNGEDLAGVTNDRAVDVLRMASASSHMSLLITRDEESRREFAELMEKYGSHSNAGSARSSPTPHSPGRLADSPCCSTCSGSLSPKDTSPFTAAPTLATAAAAATSAGSVQTVTVPRGLGLNVTTGNNRPPGPLTSGGDSTKVRGGEQLVSINKESLLGVTQDETPSPPGLRPESSVEMASVRRGSVAGEGPLPSPPSPGMKPPGFSFLLAPPNYRRGPGPPTGAPPPDRPLQGKSAAKKLDVSPSGSPTNSLPDPHSPAAVGAGWTQPSVTRGRSLSLNPSFRLKVEKLEMALGYLGIEPSPEQQHILRTQLLVDSNGTVAYGDFVQAARDMFRLQLDESASEPTASTLTPTCSPPETALSTQVLPPGTAGAGDLDRTSRERNEALKELKKVKDQLAQSEKSRKALSEELQKVRQEARCAVEEGRSLRGRAHLAEAAQRQARGMEMDYEEVVRLLEAEISELKAQRGHSKDDTQDLRKRLAVMDCQLRKSEAARKTFQLATGKLLQFVEMDLPTDTPAARTNACPGARRFSQPAAQSLARSGPGITGISGGKVTALSSQAQELCTSVRALIEADCLPYGWEESHTADGTKYFINHVTQTTSWVHPVTSALPRADRARDTTSREPPDFNS